MDQKSVESIDKYLAKQPKHQFKRVASCGEVAGVRFWVVIPALNEPLLLDALKSIWYSSSVEPYGVCVVLNANESAPRSVEAYHEDQVSELQNTWLSHANGMPLEVLMDNAVASKWAGVGLARKVGLDHVLALARDQKQWGWQICMDGDSVVAENYMEAIQSKLNRFPQTCGFNLFFKHPLQGISLEQKQAIMRYELHLRLYRQLTLFTGHPFGFHTVGSSMGCSMQSYVKQGGMNRRKAGEDFYFLNKIMMLGNFQEINETTVYPSARVSDRVPFGTGRAMGEILKEGKEYLTYNPLAFKDLRLFFKQLDQLFLGHDFQVSAVLKAYLNEKNRMAKIESVIENCSNLEQFQRRFYAFFDLFEIMKYVHFARDQDHEYADVPVQVLGRKIFPAESELEAILTKIRVVERQGLSLDFSKLTQEV